MNLKHYLKTKGRGSIASLSKAIGGHASDVSDWANGVRPIPPVRCVEIERATDGLVTRSEMRPNDYVLIWPELSQYEDS